MPLEQDSLKTAVSRFLVEQGKLTTPTMPPSAKMIAYAKQVQSIVKDNPAAKADFLRRFPHFEEACEKALAFTLPEIKAPVKPPNVKESV